MTSRADWSDFCVCVECVASDVQMTIKTFLFLLRYKDTNFERNLVGYFSHFAGCDYWKRPDYYFSFSIR